MKIFYVLHIQDKALADCVDAIRFICNPAEKQRAHLTVRGPYQKKIDVSSISRKIVGDTVLINSVGNFFDSGQATVFFRCSAPELRNVWNKPNYPFNPHITIYDSESKEFARRLFALMSKYHYSLKFQASDLEIIESRKGQDSFSLAFAFNSTLVSQVIGERLTADRVSTLSTERRLQLVDRLCAHLSAIHARSAPAGSEPWQRRLPL